MVGSDTEYLSVVRVWDYWLGLHWGRESRGRVFIFKTTSLSTVTTLITIPSTKESTAARRGLVL